jgi:hypothetical protein
MSENTYSISGAHITVQDATEEDMQGTMLTPEQMIEHLLGPEWRTHPKYLEALESNNNPSTQPSPSTPAEPQSRKDSD